MQPYRRDNPHDDVAAVVQHGEQVAQEPEVEVQEVELLELDVAVQVAFENTFLNQDMHADLSGLYLG